MPTLEEVPANQIPAPESQLDAEAFDQMLANERKLQERLQQSTLKTETEFEYSAFEVLPDTQLVFRQQYDKQELPAIEEGKTRIEVGTGIQGILDAAKQLSGSAMPELQPKILDIQEKITKDQYDEETKILLDKIFAASFVGANRQGEPAVLEYPNEVGLVESVLMLAGDEQAAKIVDAKLEALKSLDAEHQHQEVERYGVEVPYA